MNASKKFRVTRTIDSGGMEANGTTSTYDIGGDTDIPPVGDVVMRLHRLEVGDTLIVERIE